jgi:predicted PurR-regulated permease PerM
MNDKKTIPSLYLKILQISLFTSVIMYFGSALFIPLSFGLLIALILYPFCNWLEKHRWPRSLTIVFSLIIVTLIFAAVVGLMYWQLSLLKADLPFLIGKLQDSVLIIQEWFTKQTGIIINADSGMNGKTGMTGSENILAAIQPFLMGMGNFLFSLFIIPVFTALFLYNREQFVSFLQALISQKYHESLHIILHKTTHTYYRYIIGLMKVYLIVGILNSIGLLALGIKHAILFGMLTAIMTMIPYVGIIVSALLPITVAWITKDSIFYPLGVVAVFAFVQYLENSVIFPKVVGEQLNVSTWTILVALIAGGIIWGVSGMILFMPFVAILKIISDHVEEWKPLNILLSPSGKLK